MVNDPKIECGFDGVWPYIAVNGVHVAERQVVGGNLKWVAVEPGWRIVGGDSGKSGELPAEIIGPDGPVTLQ
jgi:hypothetical protein